MSESRQYPSTAVLDSRLYVCGGGREGTATNTGAVAAVFETLLYNTVLEAAVKVEYAGQAEWCRGEVARLDAKAARARGAPPAP